MPDRDKTVLECCCVWYGKSESLRAFRKATQRITFSSGVGLPGRVWVTKEPEWIRDLSTEPLDRFPRVRSAKICGLKAAFGVPLVSGGEVLAVFVFFLSTAQKKNQKAVAVVSAVANQLGSFIQLKRAEEALRRACDELEVEVQKRTEKLEEANQSLRAEVSERRRTEEALRESERKFHFLADSVPAFFAYVGADERYRFVNSRYEERFGLSPQEIVGKSVRELLGEKNYERVREHILAVLSGQSVSYEWLAPFPEHDPRWMSVRYEPELDSKGNVAGFFVLAMDVTEYRRVEEALRESEAQFRTLAESTSAAVLIAQGEEIRYANTAAEALTGYTREEMARMRFWDFVHPDFRDLVKERGLARQRGEPQPSRYELKIVTKNGEERWFDITAGVTTFEGKPAGLGTAFDITERKRIEEALRHSESRTRALLNAIPDLMFRYRLDGTYLDFHAHQSSELAIPPEAIVGAKVYQLPLPHEIIDEIMASSQRAVESGEVQTVEYSMDLPAGHQTYEARIVASEPEELVAIVRNITRRKRTEEALRSSQENLRALTAQLISAREEESKRLARELHDAFSQQLAVLGMETSALEQDASLPDSVRRGLRTMGEEISRLAKDIHQLSRDLHPSILDDLGLTAALRAECSAFSRQYNIPVRFEPAHAPESLSSPVSLGLYRIAQESLRNVGKHAGATEVRMSLEGTDGSIRLTVEDNGAGFDFDRIKGRRGLGLVSMEERVRLVEGSLQIRSQPGAGTTVEVRIPIGRSAT